VSTCVSMTLRAIFACPELEVQFGEAPLDRYFFDKKGSTGAARLGGGEQERQRSLRITKDVSSLATSLPLNFDGRVLRQLYGRGVIIRWCRGLMPVPHQLNLGRCFPYRRPPRRYYLEDTQDKF
jgi:hypothetical protein